MNNCAPFCPGHHTVKTEAHWTVQQTTPGHFTFTDPHGRTYTTTPPRLTDPMPDPETQPDNEDPPPF